MRAPVSRSLHLLSMLLFLFALQPVAATAKSGEVPTPSYEHNGKQYPPVLLVTNIEAPGFAERLEDYGAFSRIDKESLGLPFAIRVLKGRRAKQDGTGFSSMMLSASTLGIIPVVSNTEFKVMYQLFLQGKPIAKYIYEMDSTDVNNIWTAASHKDETKPDEVSFIEQTLPQFLTELRDNQEVQNLFAEYWEYFDQ